MEALACTMMVAVLSSRISFRRGVGSRLSSSIRTERVSLEMRNCRSNFSRFKRPSDKREEKKKKPDTFQFYACSKSTSPIVIPGRKQSCSSVSMHCKGKDLGLQRRLAAWASRERETMELLQLFSRQKMAPKASWEEIRLLIQICSGPQSPDKFWLLLVAGG